MKNKVKYNLKNVHWSKLTFDENNAYVYGPVHAWPGAVSMSLDAEGDPTIFHADGIQYHVVNNNNGYKGDYECALIPEDFRTEILGDIKDNNGVLIEDADAPSVHFALMFEFDGDAKQIKHVVYNNTATRPKIESKTKEESVEVKTEALSIKSMSIFIEALGKNIVKAKTGDETSDVAYNNWYNTVYIPNTVSNSVQISGPSNVEADDTITLTATTVPASASVVWSSNNENVATVSNGVVTGVAAGKATIMATLATDGSVFDTKVITVAET